MEGQCEFGVGCRPVSQVSQVSQVSAVDTVKRVISQCKCFAKTECNY